MTSQRELDLFNVGYDLEGNEAGLSFTISRILKDLARPDRGRAIQVCKAGYHYYCLECDVMDDGSRLPYRPR